jgi:tetratricopeptide (TPR) repeat protein
MIERLLEADRLLALGLTDQAERIYWQAAEMDPRDAIAVVGLARVASEKGDDRTALEFARRAVQIDPENPAAQRLAARLEEILATRDAAAAAEAAGAAASAMSQAAALASDAEAAPPAGDAAADPAGGPGQPPSTTQASGPGPAAQPGLPGAHGPTSGTRSTKKRRGLLGRLLGGR